MQGRTLGELAHYFQLDGLKLANAQKRIRHLVLDSRKVGVGDVYIAYQGASFDGHAFIEDAIKQGAIAVICECDANYAVTSFIVPSIKDELAHLATWFYSVSEKLNMIGVTGTNGKTSIVCLYAQLAILLNESCGVLGTIGNGLWPNLKSATRTTDNALALWQNLSILSKKTRQVAMEVSSHALDQQRLLGLKFSCVIWSNLSHDHLDYHRTLECYFRAKLKLFTDYNYDCAVLNYDNEWGKKIKASLSNKKILSYSLSDKSADLYVEILMKKKVGYRIALHYQRQQVPTEINLVGRFNLENIAAVVCAHLARGVPLKSIASRLPQLEAVTGRMEMIKPDKKPFIVLDYAHTPDALEKALITIRSQMNATQKLWCVFGCGGDRDISKRAIMASIAERLSDKIVATSDNPRSESQELIFQDMKEGFQGLKPVLFMENRKNAIEYAFANANEDDWILLAGKGHERYQEINGDFFVFDEKEIIDSLSQ
ncbi:UDP-N-acetylmuramoyl-L-alanyl-D-glutamate--2,6-diaminopimelate ligase [Thiotrichales bacterium 19S3-7]|nr:UDP-N-acetylmuramoyl-L-alanyl-D-glutamate--2,6-diaminopimelate ligase [Thiotrichales bacterium 19S3-7]MCF6802456.1 UDP-N-acetylmuramoyl-L-alanyl-D-glutamate--2,6-diaminopimelate ligase [Thiotrichales bacterium 19S3-11]